MKYIPFGEEGKEVSRLIIGLMRIAEMSTDQVADIIQTVQDPRISKGHRDQPDKKRMV